VRGFCIVAVLLLPRLTAAGLDLDEMVFRDKTVGVRLTIPDGWIPSTQTGFPSILLLLTSPKNKATISLATGLLPRGRRLLDYVAENNRGLSSAGVPVSSVESVPGMAAWEVSAASRRGIAVRQIYLASKDRVFVFTLCAPSVQIAQLVGEVHRLARSIEL
jgi:hypothetical protein